MIEIGGGAVIIVCVTLVVCTLIIGVFFGRTR